MTDVTQADGFKAYLKQMDDQEIMFFRRAAHAVLGDAIARVRWLDEEYQERFQWAENGDEA